MIRLDTTTRKLQLILGGAVSTTQPDVVVSFSEKIGALYVGKTQVSVGNSGTAVDICDAPAVAGTVRDIDHVSVKNNDTAAITATVRFNDNATLYKLWTFTLQVGDSLEYTHAHGAQVLDSNGSIKFTLGNVTGNLTVGGTLGVTGDTTLTGDLAINGGDLTSTASTFNLLAANATTVNAFGAASVALNIGNASAAAAFPGGIAPAKLVDISGAAAGQIKFPAVQNASSNVNTLDDYEEGTWTPTDASGAALSFTSASGTYTKIGKFTIASFRLIYPSTADTTASLLGSLPYAASNDFSSQVVYGGYPGVFMDATYGVVLFGVYSTNVYIVQGSTQTRLTNANLSTKEVRGTVMYFTAT